MPAEQSEPQTNNPQKLRILHIEDAESKTSELKDALQDVPGYQTDILEIAEVTEAISKISDALFDVIIFDLRQPEPHSLKTLDEVVAHAPGVAVIVVVDEDNETLGETALERGAQDYLITPEWNPSLLKRVFRYALGRKHSEEQIAKLAHYDSLTGVANRFLFNDRLSQAEIRAERSGQQIAVLFLDLDHFHGVNETLGYEMGDLLLKEAALRIVSCVRRQDTIARLGGDEFAVVLEGISDPQDVTSIAKQILEAFQEPVYLDTHPIFISVSIGMSVSDDKHRDGQTLIKQADIARYRAKDHGRNNFQFFQVSLNEAAQQRLNLEQELNQALNRIFKTSNNS